MPNDNMSDQSPSLTRRTALRKASAVGGVSVAAAALAPTSTAAKSSDTAATFGSSDYPIDAKSSGQPCIGPINLTPLPDFTIDINITVCPDDDRVEIDWSAFTAASSTLVLSPSNTELQSTLGTLFAWARTTYRADFVEGALYVSASVGSGSETLAEMPEQRVVTW